MTDPIVLRRATPADAEPLARGVVEGVAEYPAFAPDGWSGPSLEDDLAHHREDLAEEHFHCIVAERAGEIVGQITVVPAAVAPHPVDDPELGHVRNLFVARSEWGSGLARHLHAAVIEAARGSAWRSCGSTSPRARPVPAASTSARAGARPASPTTTRRRGCAWSS